MTRWAIRAATLVASVAVALLSTAVPAAATTWADVWIQSHTGAMRCVLAPNTSPGTQLQAGDCVDDADQLWTFNVDGAYFTITNLGTGLCVTETGTTAGSSIVDSTCSGSTSQQWGLVGTGHTFAIRNRASSLCLATSSGLSGASVVVGSCAERWDLLF